MLLATNAELSDSFACLALLLWDFVIGRQTGFRRKHILYSVSTLAVTDS